MAMQTRNQVIVRRAGGISNLSTLSIAGNKVTLDSAEDEGMLKVNCSHQVGIATQTEVGLPAGRFPIKVVIIDPKIDYTKPVAHTVIHYWKVVLANGVCQTYSRKPNVSNVVIQNIYSSFADLDDEIWENYRFLKANNATEGLFHDWDHAITELYDLCCVLNPTDTQRGIIGTKIREIMDMGIGSNHHPYFKVADNAFMACVPHGVDYTPLHGMSVNKVAVMEGALTAKVNYDRMRARYETLSDGVITLCAYTAMNVFRHGLAESYESTEYYTVAVSLSEKHVYTVEAIHAPAGAGAIAGLAVGDNIDISDFTFNVELVEISNMVAMISGMMHYLFNHTTGGLAVTGTLLTTLAMFSYITPFTPMEEQVLITSCLYEVLHPVNKRAIANLFFQRSNVSTHGRSSTYRKYEQFVTDSYFNIRKNPYPAGSHKAFICLTALKRVLQAGLGPFLPWADQLTACVNACRDVLTSGARAHIGSAYYTGDPPVTQPSSLDQYLPELAMYVNTFNKGDSLSLSPHMSIEIGKRAGMNWQNLLKDLKAKDVSATSADVVRSFLKTAGSVNFTFDPENEGTWATAIADAGVAQAAINAVFI